MVFTTVIALIGTWLGTVLAFYFARTNLEAASETTIKALSAARAGADDASVMAFMLPVARIKPLHLLKANEAIGDPEFGALCGEMSRFEQTRIPVASANGAVQYVVHDSDIDKYFASAATHGITPATKTDPMSTLLADTDFRTSIELFGTVPASATVKDVRALLAKTPGCKDVFVTEGGGRTESALGWITNSDLARFA